MSCIQALIALPSRGNKIIHLSFFLDKLAVGALTTDQPIIHPLYITYLQRRRSHVMSSILRRDACCFQNIVVATRCILDFPCQVCHVFVIFSAFTKNTIQPEQKSTAYSLSFSFELVALADLFLKLNYEQFWWTPYRCDLHELFVPTDQIKCLRHLYE